MDTLMSGHPMYNKPVLKGHPLGKGHILRMVLSLSHIIEPVVTDHAGILSLR